MSYDHEIEVLKAAQDGKTIQWKEKGVSSAWTDCTHPKICYPFNFSAYMYRIKPKPEEAWFVWHEPHKNCGGYWVNVGESASGARKFREVIE